MGWEEYNHAWVNAKIFPRYPQKCEIEFRWSKTSISLMCSLSNFPRVCTEWIKKNIFIFYNTTSISYCSINISLENADLYFSRHEVQRKSQHSFIPFNYVYRYTFKGKKQSEVPRAENELHPTHIRILCVYIYNGFFKFCIFYISDPTHIRIYI